MSSPCRGSDRPRCSGRGLRAYWESIPAALTFRQPLSIIRAGGQNPSSFFFTVAATTEIYTLSLHDALPISLTVTLPVPVERRTRAMEVLRRPVPRNSEVLVSAITKGNYFAPLSGAGCCAACGCLSPRSEEHTSELQSHVNLVCRLLLEKKKP